MKCPSGQRCNHHCDWEDYCHFDANLPKPTPPAAPTLEQLAEDARTCLEMYFRTMLRNPRYFDEDQAKEWPTAKVLAKYELDRALAEFHKVAQEYAFSR